MPIAWSTAMLSWGLTDFLPGYKSSGSYAAAVLNVKWGTDYLLKTIVGNTTAPGNIKLIWQARACLLLSSTASTAFSLHCCQVHTRSLSLVA